MIRDSSIYVDRGVQWLLRQIVKAHNSKLSEMEVAMTTDGLASDIILQWVKEHKPGLIALYQRRQAIDDEAAELLKK